MIPRKSQRDKKLDKELEGDADYQKIIEEEEKGPTKFHIEELGQIAPVVPIRWIDVDQMIYATPKEEYVRSPFPIDLTTLQNRWEGLWKPHDLEAAYAGEDWQHLRFVYQDERDKKAFQMSLQNDADYQKRVLNQDIESMYLILERLMADFHAGVEYKPVKGAGAFGYVKMPMTVESKARLANVIIAARKFRGVRVGLFSDLTGQDVNDKRTINDLLRAARASQDEGYAELLAVAGITDTFVDSQRKSLGSAEIIEAEIIIPKSQREKQPAKRKEAE